MNLAPDGAQQMRVEKILSARTMPAARWDKLLAEMNTRLVTHGSLLHGEADRDICNFNFNSVVCIGLLIKQAG
jgi:hypothetical protein